MEILKEVSVLAVVILSFADSAIDNSGGGGCVYNFQVIAHAHQFSLYYFISKFIN